MVIIRNLLFFGLRLILQLPKNLLSEERAVKNKGVEELLGKEAKDLLSYTCNKVKKADLQLPGPDFIDRVLSKSDRSPAVLRNMQTLFNHGRLAGTGYVSILPVDQGVEHSAGASFAPNPIYFDPENIIKLGLEGGCNAVASTVGGLGIVARQYAHKIPLIVKINHNEFLSYPNKYDQVLFANVHKAFDMGAIGVGATIYFGSQESDRQIQDIREAFYEAHSLGLVCILWCYLRNSGFKVAGVDYHESADLTGQANYLGVTLGADIIKQKMAVNNGGYQALNQGGQKFGKFSPKMYSDLATDHPIDLCRYQVLNCFAGRAGLINSGGASGEDDLGQAVRTAVINKRAGGMGLISGRKAFQKPMKEGVEILHAIQDIYLDPKVTVA